MYLLLLPDKLKPSQIRTFWVFGLLYSSRYATHCHLFESLEVGGVLWLHDWSATRVVTLHDSPLLRQADCSTFSQSTFSIKNSAQKQYSWVDVFHYKLEHWAEKRPQGLFLCLRDKEIHVVRMVINGEPLSYPQIYVPKHPVIALKNECQKVQNWTSWSATLPLNHQIFRLSCLAGWRRQLMLPLVPVLSDSARLGSKGIPSHLGSSASILVATSLSKNTLKPFDSAWWLFFAFYDHFSCSAL